MTHPALGAIEAHLWFADLCQPGEVIRGLCEALSADEQVLAARFRSEKDRRRYIVSRGLLRQILSRYLTLDPHDLVFSYSGHGKPALPEYKNTTHLYFNLSHSAEGVVYAIVMNRRVGIDLENIRPIPEADDIADRFFPPADARSYRSLRGSQREEAFFRYWTGREAILKALGHGLSGADKASDATGVETLTGQSYDRQSDQPPLTWRLRTFSPTRDYVGTVAVEGDQCDLKYYCASPSRLLCPQTAE